MLDNGGRNAATRVVRLTLSRCDVGLDGRQSVLRARFQPAAANPSNALRGSRLELIGTGTANFPHGETMRRAIAAVLDLASASAPPVDAHRVPLENIADAWAVPENPDKRVVVTV